MKRAVGVDLGGTKLAAGVVDEHGTVVGRREVPSDVEGPASVAEQIAELVRPLLAPDVEGVGIGAAGIVNHATGEYLFGPNTGIGRVDLAALVTEALGLPAVLDNDANCAAWAEHRFGVGRGTMHFLCVTLGTGIGGGIVIDGRPYRGAHGGAGEIGHMLVDEGGLECGCGRRGCWEQYASGLALERIAREELALHADSVLRSYGEGRIPGPAITHAARGGDAFAREIVERTATWVGWGLGSLVNVLEPECIAVAGGIARDWDLFERPALAAMRERVEAAERRRLPELRVAMLGADAGIVGAALLVIGEGRPSP